mmetsp:Transcript_19138/g.34752  ORF Transcript_19138/g.34752 Transcript_19138/m.34752 type:complete len:204 (-) Transcript_19138:211-822(-)
MPHCQGDFGAPKRVSCHRDSDLVRWVFEPRLTRKRIDLIVDQDLLVEIEWIMEPPHNFTFLLDVILDIVELLNLDFLRLQCPIRCLHFLALPAELGKLVDEEFILQVDRGLVVWVLFRRHVEARLAARVAEFTLLAHIAASPPPRAMAHAVGRQARTPRRTRSLVLARVVAARSVRVVALEVEDAAESALDWLGLVLLEQSLL